MSYSVDLRLKALKYLKQGGTVKEACVIFEISRSTLQRWQRMMNKTGTVNVKPRDRTPYKINNEELKAYISKHPDAYLSEIATYFQVTSQCIFIALKRLKITRKKRPFFTKNEAK